MKKNKEETRKENKELVLMMKMIENEEMLVIEIEKEIEIEIVNVEEIEIENVKEIEIMINVLDVMMIKIVMMHTGNTKLFTPINPT